MKKKIILAMMLSTCCMPTIAENIYRWVDPETGKTVTMPSLPPYPIKEKRSAGGLPDGELINVILDTESPQVKAILDKRKAAEEEQKRLANEAAEEKKRIAMEKAREEVRLKAKLELENKKKQEEYEKEEKENRINIAKIEKAKQQAKEQAEQTNNRDLKTMLKIIDEFEQYNKFASSTARIALSVPINNLISTKMKLDSYQVFLTCYSESKEILLEWMNLTIESYYQFSAKMEFISERLQKSAYNKLGQFYLSLPSNCD